MKKKFFALLKSTHPHVGVSDKAFDRVASFYEKNGYLKEESTDEELKALAEGAETLLIGMKAESDFKLEEFKKKNPAKPKAEEKPPKEEEDDEDGDKTKTPKKEKTADEPPAWAKAIIDAQKSIASDLASFKTGAVTKSRKEVLEAKLKEKQISEKLIAKEIKSFERMQFDDDESFNAYVEESVESLGEVQTEISQAELGKAGGTVVGGVAVSKAALKSTIETWAKSKAPAEAAK